MSAAPGCMHAAMMPPHVLTRMQPRVAQPYSALHCTSVCIHVWPAANGCCNVGRTTMIGRHPHEKGHLHYLLPSELHCFEAFLAWLGRCI